MDEAGRKIAQAINQALRNRYQKYLEACPIGSSIEKQIYEQKILTNNFFDLLQTVPDAFLLHQEFRRILFNYSGLGELDATIFTGSIRDAYKKLGITPF